VQRISWLRSDSDCGAFLSSVVRVPQRRNCPTRSFTIASDYYACQHCAPSRGCTCGMSTYGTEKVLSVPFDLGSRCWFYYDKRRTQLIAGK
jgi:hypothetical protein